MKITDKTTEEALPLVFRCGNVVKATNQTGSVYLLISLVSSDEVAPIELESGVYWESPQQSTDSTFKFSSTFGYAYEKVEAEIIITNA